MFQFRRFPSCDYFIHHRMTEVCSAGFPHSEICGSKDICSSPQLIAAYHVFHRLSVPRHPPCALLCLIMAHKIAIAILRSIRYGDHHVVMFSGTMRLVAHKQMNVLLFAILSIFLILVSFGCQSYLSILPSSGCLVNY